MTQSQLLLIADMNISSLGIVTAGAVCLSKNEIRAQCFYIKRCILLSYITCMDPEGSDTDRALRVVLVDAWVHASFSV